MGLFKADLYRSFAVGFVIGVFALFVTMGSGDATISANVVPHAVAAPANGDLGADVGLGADLR